MKEDVLTLSLSILLWVISLLFIYFFTDIFSPVEDSRKIADDKRVVKYYEETTDIVR
jgi:uncharacterized protein YpmB